MPEVKQTTSRTANDDKPAIGILAGWGDYPLTLARTLKAQHRRVVCLGVKDHADARLAEIADEFSWVGLGQIGAAIRYFRRRGVREATMAGKIHKVVLFQRWAWLRHRPDWTALRVFAPNFLSTKKDRRDDTLLSSVVEAFACGDITFRPATDYAPELLVKYGLLTRCKLSEARWKDIQFGWQLAKELGRLDVGQSVAVKGRAVLAIEAIEGTDECIRRAGSLCTSGGFTVVKVAKPQQDMRFDVPTIGLGTLRTMLEAKASLLAVEAGRTILLDEPEVVAFANQHSLTIVAVTDPSMVDATLIDTNISSKGSAA